MLNKDGHLYTVRGKIGANVTRIKPHGLFFVENNVRDR
jgi:hypothetical protein